MIKQIRVFLRVILDLLSFTALSTVLAMLVWKLIGKEYVFGHTIIGGDYFNAFTYQTFISKYLPNPITGWLHFWNEGSPIIGGYTVFPFYLSHFLEKLFPTPNALNLLSIASLILFFSAALALLWQISKNWLLAISLSLLLVYTQATYYQLTSGGFIAAASAQFYLPLILFFIYRFQEKKSLRNLALASLFSGISLIHHAPTALLMVFTPSLLTILTMPGLGKLNDRMRFLFSFILISLGIGAIGVYGVFLQQILGSGTGKCTSPQCWGIYPKHLIVWLNTYPPIITSTLLFFTITFAIVTKRIKKLHIVPPLVVLIFLSTYALLAYLKLIDGLANVIFPTRIFWAANLLIVVLGASAFKTLQHFAKGIPAYFISVLCTVAVLFLFTSKQITIHKEVPVADPADIANYIMKDEYGKNLKDIVPEWVLNAQGNWRIDVINPGLTAWFNIISDSPLTRGYSNHPLGSHKDWLYYLGDSTRSPDDKKSAQIKINKALFLIDAYGIGFFENSTSPYLKEISEDPKAITKKDTIIDLGTTSLTKNLMWYELNHSLTTPVVSATNAPPILYIGDDKGYETFIRALSTSNLNSKYLVPVKGPKKLQEVKTDELKNFPILFLYRFKDIDSKKLSDYLKNGGRAFIETSSITKDLYDKLSNTLPVGALIELDLEKTDRLDAKNSDVLNDVELEKFSPFQYQQQNWQSSASKSTKPWGNTVIALKDYILMAEGSYQSGYVIWSGLNLPFHIVDNDNLSEAILLRNIVLKLTQQETVEAGNFTVTRLKPNIINVDAKNSKGIYFKENYHSGWKAFSGNKNLKIYEAGLNFMYLPLNSESTIRIKFTGGLMNYFLLGASVFSIFASVIFFISPKLCRLLLIKTSKPFTKIIDKAMYKIYKEDEEEQ